MLVNTSEAVNASQQDAVTISVILPAWNARSTIARTIKSVLAQSLQPMELVIIDDGSTDGTAEVAEAAVGGAGLPVRLLRKSNGGVASARNLGVSEALGTWVAMIDADDEYLPEALASLAALVRIRPDAAVAFGDAMKVENGVIKVETNIRRRLRQAGTDYIEADPNYLVDPERLLMFGSFLAPGSFMVRRDLLLAVGPCNPRLRRAVDRDMFLRLAARAAGPWVFTWSRLSQINYVEGSLSSRSNALRHALSQLEVLSDHSRRISPASADRMAVLHAAQRSSAQRALYFASKDGPSAVISVARTLPRSAWPALAPDLLKALVRRTLAPDRQRW
mgnify:CR=1 FL=1